jgi:hypothetical protein
MKRFKLSLFCFLFLSGNIFAQKHLPIIDVHLHAYTIWPVQNDTAWYPSQFKRPGNSEELMRKSLAALNKYNIVKAVISGTPETVLKWKTYAPDRFINGYESFDPFTAEHIDRLRQRIKSGEVKVLAEIVTQYTGVSPSDSAMEILYKLAEEYDIPIGIHMGPGPPGIAHSTDYRSRLSNPILLEEALIRHPKLRLYVMHAGWPMLDDMVAMLYAFPNLYVDIAVINWYIPKAEFYNYLKRLVDAGFSNRIMFGSDQMQWPESIGTAIQAVNSAPFLTSQQKRDIFYNNAVRFFRIDKIN